MQKKTNSLGLIIICNIIIIITILTIILKPNTYNESGIDNSSPSSSSYNNTDKLNTNYLTISNVSVTSNSSYNICTGTISVKSTSPYRYHYIKVKGAFKTSSGSTVDTDWTYAIGSEWLEPGESSKFRLSVDKDYSISKCTVTIME